MSRGEDNSIVSFFISTNKFSDRFPDDCSLLLSTLALKKKFLRRGLILDESTTIRRYHTIRGNI